MFVAHGRGIAIAALAVPVLAGLAYLSAFGAPRSYLAINAAALALASMWIALAPRQLSPSLRRIVIAITLGTLFLPLLTGPAVGDVARWLPLGPFTLHAGMLVAPALSVWAGEEPDYAPAILSAALFAASLQPDMATAAALTLAAVGLADATRDWRHVVVTVVGFVVVLVASVQGELPAQPFVERVIWLLARSHPLAALALLATLVASFYAIVALAPGTPASRKALAGSLAGFAFAGLVSNYPTPLVGFGAAAILGMGLGLGLLPACRFVFPTRPPNA